MNINCCLFHGLYFQKLLLPAVFLTLEPPSNLVALEFTPSGMTLH